MLEPVRVGIFLKDLEVMWKWKEMKLTLLNEVYWSLKWKLLARSTLCDQSKITIYHYNSKYHRPMTSGIVWPIGLTRPVQIDSDLIPKFWNWVKLNLSSKVESRSWAQIAYLLDMNWVWIESSVTQGESQRVYSLKNRGKNPWINSLQSWKNISLHENGIPSYLFCFAVDFMQRTCISCLPFDKGKTMPYVKDRFFS